MAKAIQSVQSDDINDYVQAIRLGVCSVCHEQTANGNCEARKKVQCALDANPLLIVDAIQEATGRRLNEIKRTAELRRRAYLDLTTLF